MGGTVGVARGEINGEKKTKLHFLRPIKLGYQREKETGGRKKEGDLKLLKVLQSTRHQTGGKKKGKVGGGALGESKRGGGGLSESNTILLRPRKIQDRGLKRENQRNQKTGRRKIGGEKGKKGKREPAGCWAKKKKKR